MNLPVASLPSMPGLEPACCGIRRAGIPGPSYWRKTVGWSPTALSTAAAARIGLPGPLRRNAPDPVSLLLLGQLAIDVWYHGRGLGARLLRDACIRALAVLDNAGFRALATHPIDPDAINFYARYGFTAIPDARPALMVLPVHRLAAAFVAAR
jgi:GNAT superfamily N-acetyltransferase